MELLEIDSVWVVLIDGLGIVAAVYGLTILARFFHRSRVPRDMVFLAGGLLALGGWLGLSNILQWHGWKEGFNQVGSLVQLLEPLVWANLFYVFLSFTARKALQDSEAKYRLLIENQTDVLVKTDPAHRLLFVSPSFCRLFGKSEAQLLGQPLVSFCHPEDVAGTTERLKEVFSPPYTYYLEHRVQTSSGWRWLAWAGKAILDSRGQIDSVVAVGRDIGEMKAAQKEKELLLNLLEMKNKELESIVYVASHDLRSPLVNIRGFGAELENACNQLRQALSEQPQDNQKVYSILDEIFQSLHFIHAASVKMQALIDGLLEISRIGTAHLNIQPLEMNRLVKHILTTMRYQIQQAQAQVDVEPLPSCRADARMVSQVFSNLLDNAIKYREPSRPLHITLRGRTTDDGFCIYEVADNGIGIDPAYHQKIFEVFYRLDPSRKDGGEGIGLSIVLRILDRLGGKITVQSQVGHGSIFRVWLPAAENAAITGQDQINHENAC